MHSEATTMTRRTWLARIVLAAAVAPVVGLRVAAPVEAGKKKRTKKAQQASIDAYKDTCEANGGTATGTTYRGGTSVACTGQTTEGTTDWNCVVTSQGDRCYTNSTTPPPALPTTDPGNLPDQPLQPLAPSDDPLTEPGQIADQPLQPADGGDGTLYAASGTRQLKAKRRGTRKRHGRGRRHRR